MRLIYRLSKLCRAIKLSKLLGIKSFAFMFTPPIMRGRILKARGLFMRLGTTDIGIFEQIFYSKQYEIRDIFPQYIIDAGANIGLATCYFKKRWPDSNIVAIEPEDSNFELLRLNTLKFENVDVLKAGIWNKLGFLDFESDKVNFDSFVVKESTRTGISAITIAEILHMYKWPHIDLLKMDIEGAEKEIFDETAHKWLPFVKVLVIELHDRIKSGCAKSVLSVLSSYDYTLDILGENLIFTFKK